MLNDSCVADLILCYARVKVSLEREASQKEIEAEEEIKKKILKYVEEHLDQVKEKRKKGEQRKKKNEE